MVSKLCLWRTPKLKEVGAKPDLLDMSLVVALRYDLLDCVLLFALLVLPQPDQRKPASAQKFHLLEPIREPVSKQLDFLTT